MAVEIGVTVPARPSPGTISRVAGLAMRAVLGVAGVDCVVAEHTVAEVSTWTVWWGGSASAQMVELPPGRHEFADTWFVNVAPGERGEDLSLLLAVVVAGVTATVHGGRVLDEAALVGGGLLDPAELLSRPFLSRGRSAAEALRALRGGSRSP